MPVTAKLSRRFYERFGDEATNELVDWLNAVDDDYRSQLRELNELNFSRFAAQVDQRFAESRAEIAQRFSEFEHRLTRWMFTFWAGQLVALAALLYAVLPRR